VRCACIDIGSNTTRLLVADVTGAALVPVSEQRTFTWLGRACGHGDELLADTVAALAEVVAAQAAEARARGAQALRVVATAAVRRAANGDEACAALSAAADVQVELLCSEEEARLAFAGATHSLTVPAYEPVAVVGVGGGSAQLVVGTRAAGVAWSTSLPLGSGDLAAAHLHADPPSVAELDAVRGAVGTVLATLRMPPVGRALAVGGSATSLRRLAGPLLDRAGLAHALAAVVAAPAAATAADCAIVPERLRLLPAGILVLDAIAALVGPLEVARGGLREGVVAELAGG
jgi:exopolyphosphatase/guanosine-5'-triphosphate,3'-diphosphate pyrophosphatase